MTKRRFLAILLALTMIFQSMPVDVLAETINGWMLTSAVVEGDQFYEVTFKNGEQEVAKQYVQSGKAPVLPEDPAPVEGKEFTGWYPDPTETVTGATVYEAQFQAVQTAKVVINYLNANDNVAVSHQVVREYTGDEIAAAREAGETQITVFSPEVPNLYPDRQSVTFDLADLVRGGAAQEYTVYYAKGDATYTVEHWFEKAGVTGAPSESDYVKLDVADTKGSSRVGNVVTAIPVDDIPEGYSFDHGTSAEVTGKEGTVVKAYYTRNTNFFVFDSQGGTPVKSVSGKYGATVTLPTPERSGYTFQGWYTLPNGAGERIGWNSSATMPAAPSTTLYAKWQGDPVNYKVVYWLEKPNFSGTLTVPAVGEPNDNFVFLKEAGTRTGAAGSKPVPNTTDTSYRPTANDVNGSTVQNNERAVAEYLGYQQVELAGDGTSVLNVYYKRIPFTFTFTFADGNRDVGGWTNQYVRLRFHFNNAPGTNYLTGEYSIQVKYEQDINSIWPSTTTVTFQYDTRTGNNSSYNWNNNWRTFNRFRGWTGYNTDSGTITYGTHRYTVTAEMLPKSDTTVRTYNIAEDSVSSRTVNYWVEGIDGDSVNNYSTYTDKATTNRKKTTYWKHYTSQTYYGSGSMSAKSMTGFTYKEKDNGSNPYNFYYTRNKSTIYFNENGGGAVNDVSNVPFEKYLTSYRPASYMVGTTTKTVDGVTYHFTGWYYEPGCYTPVNWETDQMPAGDLQLYAGWERERTEIEVDLNINDGAGHTEKYNLYVGDRLTDQEGFNATPTRDGYTFTGWYSDAACTQKYSPDSQVSKDDHVIYAGWERNKTSYTVRYLDCDKYTESKQEVEVHPSKTETGLEWGTDVTVSAVNVPWHILKDTSPKNIELNWDASKNVIVFLYQKVEEIPYTVQYGYKDDAGEWHVLQTSEKKYSDKERVVEYPVNIPDYYATEPWVSQDLTAEDFTGVIRIEYKPYNTAPYTIEYYFGNEGNTAYTKNDDMTESGTVLLGNSVDAKVEKGEIEGYKYSHYTVEVQDIDSKSRIVYATPEKNDDQNTIVKIYYDLIQWHVDYRFVNKGEGIPAGEQLPLQASEWWTVEEHTLTDPDAVYGWTFHGWYTDAGCNGSAIGKAHRPDFGAALLGQDTVHVYGYWTRDKISLTVRKVWQDSDGQPIADPPASLAVQLKNGETAVATADLTATDGWSHTFENLVKVGDGGFDIAYTVEEEPVNGYTPAGTAQNGNDITITNTYDGGEPITIGGTKTWIDGNQEHNNSEQVQLTLSRSVEGGEPETVDAMAEWCDDTYTFSNLPAYNTKGEKYTYSVTEAAIKGYTPSYDDYDITNTRSDIDAERTLTITKVWDDAGNQDGIRPESVSIQVKQDGSDLQPVTLSAADAAESDKNTWSATITVRKYDKTTGAEYTYTVVEPTVKEGYTSKATGDMVNGFTVTNTHTPSILAASVKVQKVWVDGNGKSAARPGSVTVQLLQNDKDYRDPVTLNDENGWASVWKDLPAYVEGQQGVKATYKVVETAVPDGYTATYAGDVERGFTVTNTISDIDEKISISGTKTWVDGGKTHNNATEVTLTLSRKSAKEGSTEETVTGVTATWSGNTYTFKDVAKYDAEGYEYTYSVAEGKVEGYTSAQVGNDFTNTMSNIGEKTSVTGTKTWVDGGKTHNNATEVTLTLSRTSAKAGSTKETVEGVTATWEGNTYTFAGVAKYDAEGYEYTYSVAEGKVEGYTSAQVGNDFTNTIEQEKVEVSGTKTWIDGNNESGKRPESITINLYRDDVQFGTAIVTEAEDGTWSYSFTDLDKYDLSDGHVYEYTVKELPVPGYDTELAENDRDFINTITQETVSVFGNKYWVDGGKEHNNAEELTLTLSRTSENPDGGNEPETVEATARWRVEDEAPNAYAFDGLPKYDDDGYEYTYTVTEAKVDGYTRSYEDVPDDFSANKLAHNIINTMDNIGEKTEIKGTKTWQDVPNEDGSMLEHNNADEVKLRVYRTSKNPEKVDESGKYLVYELQNTEFEVSWDGDNYTISGIRKYDDGGYEYTYTVKEADHYSVPVENNETGEIGGTTYLVTYDSYDITNTSQTPSLKVEKTAISAPENGTAYELGETVTYTITVTNNGYVTVNGINVEDLLTELHETIESLAPNDSEEFTTEYTVQEPNILDGYVANSASAEGHDEHGNLAYDHDEANVPTVGPHPGLTTTKTLTNLDEATGEIKDAEGNVTGKAFKANETAKFDIVVENTGNTTQYDVVVTDTMAGAKIVAGDGYTVNEDGTATITEIAPNASVTVKAEYTVTQDDIDNQTELENTATVDGGDGDKTGPDPEPIPTEDKNPGLTTTKTLTNLDEATGEIKDAEGNVTGKAFKANETAKFDIVVKNTGNTTQHDVVVTDTMAGAKIVAGDGYTVNEDGTATIPTIEAGKSVTVKAEYTVTQDDIDSQRTLVNTATVEGEGPTPDPDPEPIPEEEKNPGLTTVKTLTNSGSGENGAFKANETATFDIVVENTGNTTQHDVVVTDTMAGAKIVAGDGYTVNEDGTATIPTIEAGKSVTVKAEYTVTQDDIDNQTKLANTATVEGEGPTPDPDPEPIPTEDDNPGLTVEKTASAESIPAKLGETITYTITVTNSGNVTVSNITVTDPLTGMDEAIETLAPNASATFTTTYVVTEADILAGEIVNTATATGTDPNDNEVTGSDTETITDEPGEPDPDDPDKPVIAEPEGELTVEKTASAENDPANLGDTITYTITVTNTGNVTVSGITVTDPLTGMDETIETLAPDASATFTTTYVVTEADILAGEIVNTATATGTDPNDNEVTGSDTETITDEPGEPDPDDPDKPVIEEPNGHLTITKTTTSTPENGSAYALGETITYSITAENDGNLTITDITVTDELTGDEWTIESLAPGASETFTAEYVVTEADVLAGSVVNEATATGTSPDPDDPDVPVDPDDTEDPTETPGPSLFVEKTADTTSGAELGDEITYTITVLNNGNVTVSDIIVTDPMTGLEESFGTLTPGERASVTTTHTITEADILAGRYVNTATATGADPTGEPVTGSGTETVTTEPKNGHLTITKTTTSTPADGTAYVLGETITYRITATNDGNLTLTDVTVTDELTGDAWTIESLEPGESETFTAEYVVTEADILAGSVVNVATATGTSPDPDEPDVPVDPGEEEVPTDPKDGHLTITKTTTSTPANGTTYALGETIAYSITATNDGNLTLTDVTVTDELTGDEWTIESLAPGVSETFTARYTVTEADVLAGSVVNVATATGTSPDPDEPDVPVDPGEKEDPTQTPNPSLFVEKVSDKTGTVVLGETITYTINVTNNGNVTANDITVTDPLTGDTWTIESLAPAARRTFTATYVVTEADILAGEIVNTATATGTDPDDDPVTDDDTETVPTAPKNGHLTITKAATGAPENGTAYALGETITYSITATNDGNLTLTDITVADELTGDEWTIESLEPGDSETFTAEYVVTEADILAGSVVNVATATGTSPDPDEPEVPVEPGEEEVPTEEANASYTVLKTVTNLPEAGLYNEGETVAYNIHVENTGNVTVRNLVITEAMTDAVIAAGEGYAVAGNLITIEALEPGQALDVPVTYTVTNADLGAPLSNSVTVSADGPDEENPDENKPEDQTSTATVPTAERTYTLTVHYRYLDGTEAFADYVQGGILAGTEYNVASPALDGFTVTPDVVTGVMQPMNWEVTVFYVPVVAPAAPAGPNPVIIDEYGVPLNIGNVVMNVGDCFE